MALACCHADNGTSVATSARSRGVAYAPGPVIAADLPGKADAVADAC
ncbi:hypothetical protein H4W33_001225 [Kibdelosporangium phytohabitans]|nr:hypothetical protein [Kibdelosporangium phytohabitans]